MDVLSSFYCVDAENFNGCDVFQNALAKFMGTAEAIIYAYDLSTVPSVVPAFANARDLIVVDEVRSCTPVF